MKATNDNVGGADLAIIKLSEATSAAIFAGVAAVRHLSDEELNDLEMLFMPDGGLLGLAWEAIRIERLHRAGWPKAGGDVA